MSAQGYSPLTKDQAFESTLVSVVITTKNEAKNIRNCLESIKSQSWANLEIIVIDNFSDDETTKIANQYTNKVYLKGPERSAQRNFGMIEVAKGAYVLYVDADMILSPILIECCMQTALEKHYVALHLPELVLGTNFFSRVRRFERTFYNGTPIDGARFFDRKTFVAAGGFDQKLFVSGSGEDWDIDKTIRKVGVIGQLTNSKKILDQDSWFLKSFIKERGIDYDPSYAGIYHNEAEFQLLPYLRKKYYYSVGFNGYIQKWGKNDPDIRRQFGLHYRYIQVFTENGKWKQLLKNPQLAVGLYFLRFLVGIVYVIRRTKRV